VLTLRLDLQEARKRNPAHKGILFQNLRLPEPVCKSFVPTAQREETRKVGIGNSLQGPKRS